MSRPQSRASRQSAFMEEAKRMYAELEEWYDEHPQASFEESEAEARKGRRKLMGKALEQWVNGRDSGGQVKAVRGSAGF